MGKIRDKVSGQAIDVIVVAFASAHGGVVYTGDVEDLERIRAAHFPAVRVLGVGDAT